MRKLANAVSSDPLWFLRYGLLIALGWGIYAGNPWIWGTACVVISLVDFD